MPLLGDAFSVVTMAAAVGGVDCRVSRLKCTLLRVSGMGVQLWLMDVAKRAQEKTEMPMADSEVSPLAGIFGYSHSLPVGQGRDQHGQLSNIAPTPTSVEMPDLTGKTGFKNCICSKHTLFPLMFPKQCPIKAIPTAPAVV